MSRQRSQSSQYIEANLRHFAKSPRWCSIMSNSTPEVPVKHVLTFRYILNHEPACILARQCENYVPQPVWPPPPPPRPPPAAVSVAVPVTGGSAVAGGSAGSGGSAVQLPGSRQAARPARLRSLCHCGVWVRVPAEAGALPTTAADIDNEAGSSRVAAPAAETDWR